MVNFSNPNEDVAEGLVISTDPMVEVNGVPLGLEFCKVLAENQKNLMPIWKNLAMVSARLDKLLANTLLGGLLMYVITYLNG